MSGTCIKYQYLDAKITERGIKKVVVARALGITPKALANKLHGKAPFKWPEVQVIQTQFFPDIEKDELFQVGASPYKQGYYGQQPQGITSEGA